MGGWDKSCAMKLQSMNKFDNEGSLATPSWGRQPFMNEDYARQEGRREADWNGRGISTGTAPGSHVHDVGGGVGGSCQNECFV